MIFSNYMPHPVVVAFVASNDQIEDEATELRPVSRLSVSSPVLDEADYSPSKKAVIRRTYSEPPEASEGAENICFNHATVDLKAARRSWKSMTRERVQSGGH